MKQLKFHKVSAKNFICFGPEGIQINFSDYGNIVAVNGENLDTGDGDFSASNGTGKSTLQDIISFALYGKTVKKPKKLKGAQIVNAKYGKKCEVEMEFDDFRILRKLAPSKLQVWHSKDRIWDETTEVTKGTMNETQAFIEGQIGLSHRAFCNVVVFDDRDAYSFLEADTPMKREIVENLLGCDQYRKYLDTAKKLLKKAKDIVNDFSKDYERLRIESDSCEARIVKIKGQENNWKETQKSDLQLLMSKIKNKQTELEKTDTGAELSKYQEAQDKIEEIQIELNESENKHEKLNGIISEAQDKLEAAKENRQALNLKSQEHNHNIKLAQKEIEKSQSLISQLNNLSTGQQCSTCHGIIKEENYSSVLLHENNKIEQFNDTIKKEQNLIQLSTNKFSEKSAQIQKMESRIDEAKNKLTVIKSSISSRQKELTSLRNIEKPESGLAEKGLEVEILELKREFKEKKEIFEGDGPYKEIMEDAVKELEDKKAEIDLKVKQIEESEAELPYYEYWVFAFGDKGIRRFIVNSVIPALNSRISYWLQHLIDNKIELSFDDELNETIKRNGEEAFYHAMSNGERRRINLAVSQAFSHVMILHSGSCPSLVFLDEITGGGIDRSGTPGVYNMIFELAKERQIFITTHNENLMELLQGCENILLRKENDITTLVS